MLDPSRQFRALYRSFLRRIVDVELLSAQGDVTRLLIQFAALLGAFSFVFSINALPQYWLSQLPPKQLALAAVGDQEFLIATTMAVVGLFAVLSWDAVFPDIRDILVLSALPVRARTVLAAKIAAVTTGLGISVFAINAVTGLWYPFVVIHPEAGMLGGLRSFAAYWTAMTAAGLFVFCAPLAIQGLAARLLPYRLFLRVSSFLQLAAFFVILGGYFLTPGPDNLPVALASSRPMLARLPSYWFLGLFQEMNGPMDRLLGAQVFGPLARWALWSLSIAAAGACGTYALAWRSMVRRIVEQPDIVPADRAHPAAHLPVLLGHRLLRKPIERAVVLFTARTLARSRSHRIILAAFLGVGLAISMAYTRSLLYGSSVQGQFEPGWFEPNVPLTAAGFAMLFFTLAGMRAVFALTAALKANWIFRLTAVHSPQAYFGSIRKAMLGLAAAPVWLALTALYFSLWPAGSAALYVILMSAAGLILLTRLLIGFHKIPFTCSYLPGKSNMKIKFGAYGIALLTLIHMAALFSNGMLETPARTVVLGVILTAMLIRAQKRWTEFTGSPYQQLQFEDAELPEVMPLSLKRDGAFTSNLQYLDATPSVPSKPLRFRLAAICV